MSFSKDLSSAISYTREAKLELIKEIMPPEASDKWPALEAISRNRDLCEGFEVTFNLNSNMFVLGGPKDSELENQMRDAGLIE